ncbi:MAG TPA: ubiquitin-like small modifier protein 1 [Symbiobacteriaceae bacterium]
MIVKLFANLQQVAGCPRVEVSVGEDATVRDVLDALFAKVPALREHILEPDGQTVRPFVSIMVQGRLIRDLQGLDTPVTGVSEIAIFPPVAGG